MKHAFRALAFTLGLPLTICVAQAQINHVTVRTPKSPVPPMELLQSNTPPATTFQALPAPDPRSAVVYRPSLDKGDVERRVVAFQRKRADEGSPSAQYQLGLRYLRGEGVPKDSGEARKWLSLALKSGHTQAKRKLAELGWETASGQVSGSANPSKK